ncbi:MAG: hypothetical protein V4537_00295 [Pseudomonadota bacterium]
MINIDESEHRRSFAAWLRTGRLPIVSNDGTELKFNPWHDPDDGRFTHAGTGRNYGSPGAASKGRGPGNLRARTPAAAPSRSPSSTPLRKVAEFAGGVAHGVRDVGKQTASALYDAATTNPVTTVRNFGEGVARVIDASIAAEETPAHVQVRRAALRVANASAHDLGYATGQVAGNSGLAVVPGAAATKITALRRAAMARPREVFAPPSVVWPKESLGKDSLAKRYNDAATGSQPGQAPALMRTMPDGSKRPVKFDGVDADTLIDRKLKVVDAPRARAQTLRQSEVLAQHRLVGTWEVPNNRQKIAAKRLFRKLNITNIKVRIVEP